LLSNVEVKRLLDDTKSPQNKAIFLALFKNGVTLSTIRSLKYEDVTEDPTRK